MCMDVFHVDVPCQLMKAVQENEKWPAVFIYALTYSRTFSKQYTQMYDRLNSRWTLEDLTPFSQQIATINDYSHILLGKYSRIDRWK